MQQVHRLHLTWRPDIYKPADTTYPVGYYEKLVEKKRILAAQLDEAVVGHLTFVYRHVEPSKQVTSKVFFVNDLTAMEGYRGAGDWHCALECGNGKGPG